MPGPSLLLLEFLRASEGASLQCWPRSGRRFPHCLPPVQLPTPSGVLGSEHGAWYHPQGLQERPLLSPPWTGEQEGFDGPPEAGLESIRESWQLAERPPLGLVLSSVAVVEIRCVIVSHPFGVWDPISRKGQLRGERGSSAHESQRSPGSSTPRGQAERVPARRPARAIRSTWRSSRSSTGGEA